MDLSVVHCDVVVIGGGLSGLCAADKLKQKDKTLHITLLEASDRVGGRILSRDVNGVKVDLGFPEVHPGQKEFVAFVQSLGLELHSRAKPEKQLYLASSHLTPQKKCSIIGSRHGFSLLVRRLEWIALLNKLSRWSKTISPSQPYTKTKLAEELDGKTLGSFLKGYCFFSSHFDAFEFECLKTFGRSSSEISVLFFLVYANSMGGLGALFEPTDPLVVSGGSHQILDRLVDRIGNNNIVKNQPVQTISVDKDQIYVTTGPGNSYICKRVVVAVPLNLVAQIQFEPQLSPILKHNVNNWSPGHGIRFAMSWKSDQEKNTPIICLRGKQVSPVAQGLPITYLSESENGIMVGSIMGQAAVEWGSLRPDKLNHAVEETLQEYGGSSGSSQHQTEFQYWDQEPFSSATACSPRPGCLRYLWALREAHEKVIYFSGSETSTEWIGHMAGSMVSGQRAAVQVLNDLRPQALDVSDFKILKSVTLASDQRWPNNPLTVKGYGLWRWTVGLPMVFMALGYGAVLLRDKWSGIFIPYM